MKGFIKANTVDKYLSPVRQQIIEMIEPNSTVIEYGCGNGDLLFKLSDKIRSGIGKDISSKLVDHANYRKEQEKLKNLDFKVTDVCKEPNLEHYTDYSIASLLFHVLTMQKAKKLLIQLLANSETTIICGFCKPENWKQSLFLELDQRFTKHYSNFRIHKNYGLSDGLLNSIEDINFTRFNTFDPVIKIYKVTKCKKT